MLQPREYQQKIFETASKGNTLVVLPTGLGKTLIALMLAQDRLKKFPGSKIVFLAPTRPLVEQHFDYFLKNLDASDYKDKMHLFTGKIQSKKRKEIWKNALFIFSTPQCIENDLKNNLIDLNEVSLLIEDECHRCLKNYSYTYVAQQYLKNIPGSSYKEKRLLGLTASPGSDSSVIKEICNNLGIENIEVRTRDNEDVKKYLQQLTNNLIYVDLSPELVAVVNILKKSYDKKAEELKNRKLLFMHATKTNLLELQKKLRIKLAGGEMDFNILRGVSVCAQAIKIQHAIELVETQGVEQSLRYLQDMIEQANIGKSKAVKQIVGSREFQDSFIILKKLAQENKEHPKFNALIAFIEQKMKEKKTIRGIIFSQYRDTVKKIKDFLKDREIEAEVFIGQAKKNGSGLNQKEQKGIIDCFKQGKINFLVSTSIGEEGLDIPEVDLVVFYEPIPSAIRKIQRTGRTARLKAGEVAIFITKKTRDEQYFWASHHKEKKMHEILNKINVDFQKEKKDSIKGKGLGYFIN